MSELFSGLALTVHWSRPLEDAAEATDTVQPAPDDNNVDSVGGDGNADGPSSANDAKPPLSLPALLLL